MTATVIAPALPRNPLGAQLDYNIACNNVLYMLRARQNREPRQPLYSPDELRAMEFARENGISAAAFVAMLVAQDKRQAGAA